MKKWIALCLNKALARILRQEASPQTVSIRVIIDPELGYQCNLMQLVIYYQIMQISQRLNITATELGGLLYDTDQRRIFALSGEGINIEMLRTEIESENNWLWLNAA